MERLKRGIPKKVINFLSFREQAGGAFKAGADALEGPRAALKGPGQGTNISAFVLCGLRFVNVVVFVLHLDAKAGWEQGPRVPRGLKGGNKQERRTMTIYHALGRWPSQSIGPLGPVRMRAQQGP